MRFESSPRELHEHRPGARPEEGPPLSSRDRFDELRRAVLNGVAAENSKRNYALWRIWKGREDGFAPWPCRFG